MKNFARVAAAILLKLTLFGAAFTAAIVAVLGSPTPIKQAIDDSNLYDSIVETVFTEAQKNLEKDTSEEAGGHEAVPALKQAAEASFTPDVLKNSSETVIDAVYRWLNGDVNSPDFRLDLTEVKQNFIAAAGSAAESHVAGLPACTAEQLQTLENQDDIFSLPCRPPNLSPAAARERAIAELNNGDFLKDPVITVDNLPKNENGQTAFEQVEGARAGFGLLTKMPWILLILSALLAAAVVFLNEVRRNGIKNLGTTLLGTGLFLLIGTWLISFIFDQAAKPTGFLGKNANDELQEGLLRMARSLNSNFNRTLLIYCLIYIVLGGAILLVLHFTKPKGSAAEKTDSSEKETNISATIPSTDKPVESSKTTKKTV